jgi:NADH dehydrogenase/NADH:ubiquinone oxidoreductase subunit G
MGTPTLNTDGKVVEFSLCQTIPCEVAEANGIDILVFCHLKDTTSTGVCRICLGGG